MIEINPCPNPVRDDRTTKDRQMTEIEAVSLLKAMRPFVKKGGQDAVDAIVNHAHAKYNAIVAEIEKETPMTKGEKIRQAHAKYNAVMDHARAKYDAVMDHARAKYDAVEAAANAKYEARLAEIEDEMEDK